MDCGDLWPTYKDIVLEYTFDTANTAISKNVTIIPQMNS